MLKEVGVHLENGHYQKSVSDFVQIEDREENSEYRAPYGTRAGLETFVDRLLDLYEKQHRLTWHRDAIPKDEIWVKIGGGGGGDHGKNSLKFTLQVANTDRPNTHQNTVLIVLAAICDTHDIIVRFLEGGLGDELFALKSHS